MEAAGSGGRELLFQSGPGHSWLVQSYIKSAPHPFGSIIGEEIFQSGVVPSDTDFRIFRDFGRVPGLDIAFISHGHVYHTEYDTSDRIPRGSVQRAGDNVLAVLNRLTRLKNLHEVSLDSKRDSGSTEIYFDFLGLIMISYPSWVGVMVTVIAVIMVIISLIRDINNASKKHDLSLSFSKKIIWQILISFIIILITSLIVNAVIGCFLGVIGATMSWYYRPHLLFLIYGSPTIFCILLIFQKLRDITRKYNIVDDILEQFTLHSSNIILSFISVLITMAGYKSAFIFSTSLLFSVVWWIIVRLFNTDYNSWKSFMLFNLLSIGN